MNAGEMQGTLEAIAARALEGARVLSGASSELKDRALEAIIDQLLADRSAITEANQRDLQNGRENGLRSALLDRLELNEKRFQGMLEGIRQVQALPDPVGETLDTYAHPKGFQIERVRVPIGVIGIVYESRPNVTVDCAVLCLKSGNATILRGGSEAFETNTALAISIGKALLSVGIPEAAVSLIPTTDRAALDVILRLDQYIHCLIPRGGEGLIRYVTENSRIPVIKHYKGVCSVYVHAKADREMAIELAVNSKCQRPSVCNAAENLIVDRAVLESHFVPIARALLERGVELRVDKDAAETLRAHDLVHKPVAEDGSDYHEEYLDLILAVKTVNGVDDAIAFTNATSSAHSDAIVTADEAVARKYLKEVDSAAVYWNVSTRFTDGFEFGLGAEIGISTDRLHARGPMGLRELTSYKFVAVGNGQIK